MDKLATKAASNTQQSHFLAQQTISIQRLPIPSSEELAKLETIKPGITQQFMDMALNEQKHRHEMNFKEQKSSIYAQRWAFASVVLVCVLCGIGFYFGFGTQSASIACSVIVASIFAFIGSKVKNKTSE